MAKKAAHPCSGEVAPQTLCWASDHAVGALLRLETVLPEVYNTNLFVSPSPIASQLVKVVKLLSRREPFS